MTSVSHYALSYYVDLLASNQPFALSRWGDGEWACILGDSGENCDGCEYFPKLGEDLRRILVKQRPYFHAMGPKAVADLGNRIEPWLDSHNIRRDWHYTDTFIEASLHGELLPLIEQLRTKRVLYVGPKHLREIARAFPLVGFYEIPRQNCYLSYTSILDVVERSVWSLKADVVAISAGMAANVLIDDLWLHVGESTTLIDFGSLFDIYCGVASRKYMKGDGWAQRIRKNLGEA